MRFFPARSCHVPRADAGSDGNRAPHALRSTMTPRAAKLAAFALLASLVPGGAWRAHRASQARSPRTTGLHMSTKGDVDAMPSFVQTEMRAAAMALHTKDQAPREGKQPSRPPPTRVPTVLDYAGFLRDSKEVYDAFEEAAAGCAALEAFRETGLERGEALARDLEYLAAEHDAAVRDIEVGEPGQAYAALIRELAAGIEEGDASSLPRFMCHYYNHYFAHTAGGRMIGKKMADLLIDGFTLDF